MTSTPASGSVDLYWIPLGAGGHVVRLNGKVYEAITAFIEHRPRCALFHSALEVDVPDGRFVIESAPIADQRGRERGVVAEGPVGTRWAGRFRLFRYDPPVARRLHPRCERCGLEPSPRGERPRSRAAGP